LKVPFRVRWRSYLLANDLSFIFGFLCLNYANEIIQLGEKVVHTLLKTLPRTTN